MAIIRKKIGGEIQSFPYEEYWLDQDGNYKIHLSYKGESVKLRPYDYTNQNDLQYSCSTTISGLLEEGKAIIYTDDAETHYTLWKTVRDGLSGSSKNDIVSLSYIDDHFLAGYGEDFIEIDNHDIFIDGDTGDIYSPIGDIDVMMIRCGNVYAAGNGNSDHYFIKLSQKCIEEGFTKKIMITDISYGTDANKLHLCNFSFKNVTDNILESLTNNGIRLGLSGHNGELELYFKDNPPSKQQPDIIINHFCNNYNTSSINPPIASIFDKDNVAISLQGLNCNDVATYISTNEANTDHSNNLNILIQTTVNDTGQNSFNILTDYVSGFHLLSNFASLITIVGDYLGLHHNE